jgi:hypothetical protein
MTKLEALRRIAEGLGELADFEALERQGQLQEIDQRYLPLLLDQLGESGRFSIEDRGPRIQTASAHLAGTGGIKARPRAWSADFLDKLRDLLVTEGLSVDDAYEALKEIFRGKYARDADVRPASRQFSPPMRGRPPKQPR